MKRTLISLALVAAALQAQAGVTLYTNEAAYLAAVGATRTYVDFAGSPGATVSGGSFTPDVTFGSCTSPNLPGSCSTSVLHSSNAITDTGGGTAPNGVGSLAWRFNLSDVYAFSFHYISGAIDSINLVDTALNLSSIDTASAGGFIGLVSDGAAFYGGIGVNAIFPGGGFDRYFIDDFRISERGTAVPEPGALALVGLALGAAALVRRRAAARPVSPAPAA